MHAQGDRLGFVFGGKALVAMSECPALCVQVVAFKDEPLTVKGPQMAQLEQMPFRFVVPHHKTSFGQSLKVRHACTPCMHYLIVPRPMVMTASTSTPEAKGPTSCLPAPIVPLHAQLVGSLPGLGSWSLDRAPSMQWTQGHTWVLELNLPLKDFEFKVRVVLLSVDVSAGPAAMP